MIELWLPAFTELSNSLADIAPDDLDVRSIARQANVSLRAVAMPRNPVGSWEAVISAAQRQDRLLSLHAVLAARYREWPRVRVTIAQSQDAVLGALAAEADVGHSGQANGQLLRDHIWREVGHGLSLDELARELLQIPPVASLDVRAASDLCEAANAAAEGDGGKVVSRLARAGRAASAVFDKIGAPLVTELLARLLLPPA